MRITIQLISFLVLFLGSKQLFSQVSETALALPNTNGTAATSIVFIAGFDEGDNTYYTNAKTYFECKRMKIIDHLFSLGEIVRWLNENSDQDTYYSEIHIVSHSNPWLGMSLKTTGMGHRISVRTLREAKAKNGIPMIKYGINNTTKVVFHSCGLGENKALLKELKGIFVSKAPPKLYASALFNVFGGKYAGHYVAKPYYGFYPTAQSPGPLQMAKQFKSSYPNIEIDWFTALKTRKETAFGTPYSYKFNIPVAGEFRFDNAEEIPELTNRDAIMDWVSDSREMAEVLLELNIPLEKYRWKSKIVGNTLIIQGKTTVLCVLSPILQQDDNSEYQKPMLTDTDLYQIL